MTSRTPDLSPLASARHRLDEVIHSPVRFAVMCALNSVDAADNATLREQLDLSYSLLGKHAAILHEVGYLRIDKSFLGTTACTSYRLTRLGRRALHDHLEALDVLVRGLAR
ncbi:hypothetical protein KEM60_01551 [Austwickia sp. TVS 96-490-7B]|uniref:transcriptional regulator n=1 Tax=Austwickia sp. TVS 96-490-7B TaxID=2830843 RepID=UPI001C57A532|nr:transcriptional regulator [Austwickia sp. TVS 96-490-7B]MBW3085354.1 hypothetical protein [Austwickia sp. TVS 96-490-7B]